MKSLFIYLIMFALSLLSADPVVARVDKDSMTDHTLFELLLADMTLKAAYWDPYADALRPLQEWKGLTFDSNGDVCALKWNVYSLSNMKRRLTGGTMAIEWLPSTVKSCDITSMSVEGTVETSHLPRGLELLNLSENHLSGTFDTRCLPPNIEDIKIRGNFFKGSLYLADLPQKIKSLSVCRNSFSGTLDLESLPESLITFHFEKNQFGINVNHPGLPAGFRYFPFGFNGPTDGAITRI